MRSLATKEDSFDLEFKIRETEITKILKFNFTFSAFELNSKEHCVKDLSFNANFDKNISQRLYWTPKIEKEYNELAKVTHRED